MAKAAPASYEDMSLEELKALIEEISGVYEAKVDERRKELMAELESLGGMPKPQPTSSGKTFLGTGKSAPAKYKDPKTGETWSGRGQMAGWLKAKVDAGEEKDKYLIAA